MNPLILLFVVYALSFTTSYADSESDKPEVIAEGGRLYDKWWKEYDLSKPSSTHPAYPKSGNQSGANTWRCKECHGWDYKGAAGAYAKGSHYTGIKGITQAKSKSLTELVAVLKNNIHQYDKVMTDYGLIRIAKFIKQGQVDITSFLEKKSKLAMGNINRGQSIYEDSCKECHGSDGRNRNFKTHQNAEYIGTVATKNPWEAIHKIRTGHPDAFVMGEPMPHMLGKIEIEEQVDLLRYMQSLPVK